MRLITAPWSSAFLGRAKLHESSSQIWPPGIRAAPPEIVAIQAGDALCPKEAGTIALLQTWYNVYTQQQAARRSWRIGQKYPVRVVYFGYASSSQIPCLQLMAKKIAVAQSTSGDVPESGLDALNSVPNPSRLR